MPYTYPFNYSEILIPRGDYTGNYRTDRQINMCYRGFVLFMYVYGVGDPPGSVTLEIQIEDPASTNWFVIWRAAAAINAIGLYAALFWPSSFTDAAELYVESVDIAIPRIWRLFANHANNVDSITYSMGVAYIKG